MTKTITARWNSTCPICGNKIVKGEDTITRWSDGPVVGNQHSRAKRWAHVGCVKDGVEVQKVGKNEFEVKPVDGGELKKVAQQFEGQILEEVRKAAEKYIVDGAAGIAEGAKEAIKAAREKFDGLYAAAMEGLQKRIEEFDVPREIVVKVGNGEARNIGKQHTHAKFERILKLAMCRLPVFLPGPAGCGKTHLAKQVADALGLEFAMVSCTGGMSETQLTGRQVPAAMSAEQTRESIARFESLGFSHDDAVSLAGSANSGNFQFQMTEFIRMYENGGVFLLDEIDAADPNVLLVMNAAIANGSLPLPNRTDKPRAERHDDFVLIAAANTIGRGADRMYAGRNQLDAATLDRFKMSSVPMDYDRELEKLICPHKDILEFFWGVRDKVYEYKIEELVSTRSIENATKLRDVADCTLAEIEEMFFETWDERDAAKVGYKKP